MPRHNASPRLLIVKVGSTFPHLAAKRGDYEDWLSAGMGMSPEDVQVVRPYEDEVLPLPDAFAGVVVTGSGAMVSHREPWSERTAEWLCHAVAMGVPTLGVCYGHQLLAHALGGEVADNPLGREIGTHDVTLTEAAARDALLTGLPTALHVPVTHVQSVLRLPTGATRLATSARDPNHAFVVGESAWGLQFHPEYDAAIVRTYIEERREKLLAEGLDADALHRDARDTDHGPRLLQRFAALTNR